MESGDDLSRIREAVRKDAMNGELRYLLGVELAQHGDYEQAVIELTAALELHPTLHTARFQLGLLYLTMARAPDALAAWAPLDKLADDAYLKMFKQGLELLIRDDFSACIAHLERGIALNSANEPLNRDMGLVIGKCRAALAERQAKPPTTQASQRDNTAPGVRTDFSLYDGPTTRQ
jgi:Flp pilus assembly protein TadD